MRTQGLLRRGAWLLVMICGMATAYAQVSLDFSSFLGGSGSDSAQAVAVAPDGCIWVCGYTESANFPLVNPIDSTLGGSQDAFISKLSPDGQTLLFSTYLGGSSDDLAMGIAVDDHGDVYICGRTDSSDFPTLNAFQPTRGGFWTDMFICKLNSSGAMIYSSYLGGSMFDYGYDVAVDSSGCAYVAGKSYSTDFPTTVNAFQTTNMLESGYNFTLTKVASNGASMVYSTYLGGSGAGHDYPCVEVTPEGIAYFGGATTSTNYPVVNAYQATHAGPSPFSWDAVVSIFSADGSSLTYSTYLGGSEDIDQIVDLALGDDGSFTVVGITQSDNFPLVNPIQPAISGQPDLFVTRFAPNGQSLEFSTYLGGWDWDYGQGVAVGHDGSVVAVGTSVANNYPVFKAFQTTNAGSYECVVSKLSPDGTSFKYSTYLGGSGSEFVYRVALDADGHAVVVGRTTSDNFPTANPFQAARSGSEDGFVTRLKLMEYCESYSANHSWEFINRVQFNTIDNSSGGSPYTDFTAITTQVERGNAYLITVNNADAWSGDRCHVWVDWNRNYNFSDPGEEIELLTQNWAVFTNLITVPPGAASGPTRMRVALRDSGLSDPCGLILWGEVEDYTVNVKSREPQNISDFLPINGSSFMWTDEAGLSATSSSGLEVSFEVIGGPGIIAGGTNLSFTGTGVVLVVASQAGDAIWDPAPNVTNAYTVGKATAQVYLMDLVQTYNGAARTVTATTMPAGLTVELTYDGNAWAPTNAGSYAVVGTVNDANWEGTANDTLLIMLNELRINCGGSDVGEWVKDYGFSGKTKTYGVSRKIKNTGIVPQNVMRRVRGVFAPNVLEYRFAQVPPGEYVVYLHFADIYAPGQGQARFDVQIQGGRVLAGFDVNGAAGGFDRAIVKGFRVTVGGDGLQLKFKPRKGGAYINAIEVLPIRVEDAEIRSQSGISEKRTAFDGAFGKASVVPLDVWTSGNRDESSGGESAVDGNLSTAWIGDADAETWWITLGYRLLTPVSGVNVLLGEDSITNLSFIGSQDGVDWFDLEEALMNGPTELEYLWIQFLPGDGEANLVPNVLEIEVEKPDGD